MRVKGGSPLDYRLCDQTVTLYHADLSSEFVCDRVVFPGAFLDFRKVQTVDKTGSRETNGFLLILPSGIDGRPTWAEPQEYDALPEGEKSGRYTLRPHDKVLLGVGPVVATREEWQAFIPAKVGGLVTVQDIDPKYWRSRVCHVEAGG